MLARASCVAHWPEPFRHAAGYFGHMLSATPQAQENEIQANSDEQINA